MDPQEELKEEPAIPAEDLSSEDDYAGDATLRALFNSAGESDDEVLGEDGKEEEKETPTAEVKPNNTPVIDDERFNSLSSRLDKINDDNAYLKAQNEMLKMRLEDKERGVDREEDSGVDIEEFNEKLKTNPAQAIVEFVNTILPKSQAAAVQRALQGSNANTQVILAQQQDVSRAKSEFDTLMQSNPEFAQLAANIYDEMTAHAPVVNDRGTKYFPGAVYRSMQAAYSEMVRMGKIKPAGVTSIQERRKPPIDPLMGEKTATNAPKTVLSMMSPREITAAKRAAKEMGVPFERYVARLEANAKKDPTYGGFSR